MESASQAYSSGAEAASAAAFAARKFQSSGNIGAPLMQTSGATASALSPQDLMASWSTPLQAPAQAPQWPSAASAASHFSYLPPGYPSMYMIDPALMMDPSQQGAYMWPTMGLPAMAPIQHLAPHNPPATASPPRAPRVADAHSAMPLSQLPHQQLLAPQRVEHHGNGDNDDDDDDDGTHRVKGPWSPEEDALLTKLVLAYGDKQWRKWSVIAQHVPGRIGKQCRERWLNNLDTSVKKTPWTQEEDDLLLRYQAQLGNRWCEISKLLPGRPENSVKNRYNSLVARNRGKEAKKSQSTGDAAGLLKDVDYNEYLAALPAMPMWYQPQPQEFVPAQDLQHMWNRQPDVPADDGHAVEALPHALVQLASEPLPAPRKNKRKAKTLPGPLPPMPPQPAGPAASMAALLALSAAPPPPPPPPPQSPPAAAAQSPPVAAAAAAQSPTPQQLPLLLAEELSFT